MKLLPLAACLLLLKGREVRATFKGTARGLQVFLLETGRTVRLKRPRILQRFRGSRWDNLPAPRVPLKRESKAPSESRRQRCIGTPPGKASTTRAKPGNAKPVLSCQCQLCGGAK